MVNNWKKLLFASLVCVCSCYSKNMLILFPGCLLNFWAHGTTIVTFRSRDKLSDYFILLLFPHLSGSTIKLMVSIPPYPLQNITVFIPLVWFPPSLSNTSASYLTLPFNASLPSSLSSLCQVFFFFFLFLTSWSHCFFIIISAPISIPPPLPPPATKDPEFKIVFLEFDDLCLLMFDDLYLLMFDDLCCEILNLSFALMFPKRSLMIQWCKPQ